MKPGTQIGAYTLGEQLGRGGMGAVYRARSHALGRDVALKLIEWGSHDPEALARFQLEAQAAARLRHRGIVRVHELGVHGATPFLIMELVPGESLQARIGRAPPLSVAEAVGIAVQLSEALAHAHGHEILHRDVKPANVILAEGGRVVLTDFGLAKDLADTKDRLTRTGELIGTPAFMPPEQAGTGEATDMRADVYAVGATLYAALTGVPPFQGQGALATAFRVLNDPASAPSRLRPEVPAGLDAIVLRCLEKQPEQRYPSAQALCDALVAFREGKASQPAPRGGGLMVGVALLVVLGLGAMGRALGLKDPLNPPAKAPPGRAVPAAPTPRPPEAQRELSADEGSRGHRDYNALQRVTEPRARLARATEWLEAYPGHPRAAEMRALREEARYRVPLFRLLATRNDELRGLAVVGSDRLLVGYSSGRMVLYRDKTKLREWTLPVQGAEQIVAPGDQSLALVAVTRGLCLFPPDGAPPAETRDALIPVSFRVRHLAGSPTEPIALVAGRQGERSDLLLVNLITREIKSLHEGSVARFEGLAFSPDGAEFVVGRGRRDQRLKPGSHGIELWSTDPLELVWSASSVGVCTAVAFVPGSRRVGVGTSSGQLLIRDRGTGEVLERFRASVLGRGSKSFHEFGEHAAAHVGMVRGVQALPGGRLLSVGGRSERGAKSIAASLRYWSAGGQELFGAEFPEGEPSVVQLNAARTELAVWFERGKVSVEVWPVPSPEFLKARER